MASGGGPPQRNHGDMGDTFAATGARAGTARPKLGADASVAGSQAPSVASSETEDELV